jgi:hypothetical protein
MQVNEAVNLISRQLAEKRGVVFPDTVSQELQALLVRGRERALTEQDEESFDHAVAELSGKLVDELHVAAQVSEGGQQSQARATSDSFKDFLRRICPLWPFC